MNIYEQHAMHYEKLLKEQEEVKFFMDAQIIRSVILHLGTNQLLRNVLIVEIF